MTVSERIRIVLDIALSCVVNVLLAQVAHFAYGEWECQIIFVLINLFSMKTNARVMILHKPGSNSTKDQELAYSDKTVFHLVPSAVDHDYSYPAPVLKNDEHGIKVYELHPVPVPPSSSKYAYVPSKLSTLEHIPPVVESDSLAAALLLSNGLGVPALAYQGTNHAELLPVNPYIALLLSQYGRYLPLGALGGKGIYFYSAVNNYHNNRPFGSYKVHEDSR